jgi:Fe-S-cluster containining protein
MQQWWRDSVNKNSDKVKELPLPCLRCGVCCTRHQVRLGLLESQQIASKMGFGWEEWLDLYTDRRWPGTDSFLLRHCNGACVFLEKTEGSNVTLCLIQSFKPSTCKEWIPGLYRRDCQDGIVKQGK